MRRRTAVHVRHGGIGNDDGPSPDISMTYVVVLVICTREVIFDIETCARVHPPLAVSSSRVLVLVQH